MKKIKVQLEYQCFPIWLYDENENLIDNDFPDQLADDPDIDLIFVHLQKQFDSLYLDDSYEFRYIGFTNETVKQRFAAEFSRAVQSLREKAEGLYQIENCVNLENL